MLESGSHLVGFRSSLTIKSKLKKTFMVPLLMVLPHLLQRAMVSFYVDETGCSHEERVELSLRLCRINEKGFVKSYSYLLSMVERLHANPITTAVLPV